VQAEGDKRMEAERRKFTVEEGDHLTSLNGMYGRRCADVV
jgi:hypothetical protein